MSGYDDFKRDANEVAHFGHRLIWVAVAFTLLSCAFWAIVALVQAIF